MRALRKNGNNITEDEEAKNFRCASFSLAAAVVLLVTGTVMMHTSDYSKRRNHMLDEFNQGVETWDDGAGHEFNSTSWELLVDGKPLPLLPKYTGDNMANPKTSQQLKGMSQYEAVKFELPGMLEPLAQPPSPPMLQELPSGATSTELEAGPLPSTALATPKPASNSSAGLLRNRTVALRVHPSDGSPSQDIKLPSTPLMMKLVRRAGGWKVCKYQQGGYYSGRNQSCTTYSLLDQVCAKVAYDKDSGTWDLDPRYGDVGCNPRNLWKPYLWRRLHAPPNGAMPKLTASMAQPFPKMTLRNADDPYLLALNITKGTLVFAEGAAQELATGLVLVVIGAVTMLPALVLYYPIIMGLLAQHRRREVYLRQGDDIDV